MFKYSRCGSSLRFYGVEAMSLVRGLIDGDPDFTWSFPPWPHEWIDVWPVNIEAAETLIETVKGQ